MCGLSVAVYFDKNGEKLTVFHLNFHNDLNIHYILISSCKPWPNVYLELVV